MPALLDSYEAERLPVAERLLETTDRVFSLVVSDSRLAGLLRRKRAGADRGVRHGFQRMQQPRLPHRLADRHPLPRRAALSETLPGLPARAPRAGDRFPWVNLKLAAGGPVEDLFTALDDTQFTLILIGQAGPATAAGHGIRTLAIPSDPINDQELARVGIPPRAFYLLRPDGYVGLAGTEVDSSTIARYLADRVGILPTSR